jgi:hypothetical protein
MKVQHDTLKLLIDSMTPSEKRMFKVYSATYGKNKKYIILFNAIEKQKTYNEAELKNNFRGNFAVLKKYLLDNLIEVLNFCGNYRDIDSLHSHEIEKYKILLHKGLSHAAEIQLRRIKKMTFTSEGFIKYLYTINQEYVSIFLKEASLENNKLNEIISERRNALNIISNYVYVADIYFTLKLALKTLYYCKTPKEKLLLKNIISPLDKLNGKKLLSKTATSFYHMAKNEYYTAIGEYQKALLSSKTYIEIKEIKNGKSTELQTILEVANYLLLSLKCYKYDMFEAKLNWLEETMGSFNQTYHFLFCYERWYLIKLRYIQVNKSKNDSILFIQKESKRFKELNSSFTLKYKAAAYYFNALSFYSIGDYKKSNENCNHIINSIDPAIEEYLYARILRILLFIKQQNFIPLEHDARNLIRMLKTEITTRKNELKLIKHLQKSQQLGDLEWHKFIRNNFKQFKADKTLHYYLGKVLAT